MGLFQKRRDAAYLQRLDTRGVFDNTTKNALPQTIIAKIVQSHFASPNGKTPKALLIGFDGARRRQYAPARKKRG